jgi:hypothetical protein
VFTGPGSDKSFGDHGVLMTGDIRGSGSSEIKHHGRICFRASAAQIALYEPTNVFRQRDAQIPRALSGTTLDARLKGDLCSCHHDGTIIAQLKNWQPGGGVGTRIHAGNLRRSFGLTLKEASGRIRARKISPVELTEVCLQRIKTHNPKTNAWITVVREMAMAQARELEKEQSAGRFRSPLHGIPIGLKDNIDTAGVRTTAGSKTLEGNVPAEDAEVTRRLKSAGAIPIGKCSTSSPRARPRR